MTLTAFDGDAPVLKHWGMLSTPSLPLLDPHWHGMVVTVSDPYMDEIEPANHFLNLKTFKWAQTND